MERVDATAAKDRPPAPRRRLLAEILPVALILATLGGTLALVVSVQRRAILPKKAGPPPVVAVVDPPAPTLSLPPPVPPASDPGSPPEDPTPAELARLAAIRDDELDEAGRAAREAESLERAKGRTLAEASKMASREKSLRNRAKELDANLTRLESELQTLAFHRDMLARERDDAKLALGKEKARAESGYSVQPYKGPNGTWRRPIAIECTNGTVKIQPDGPTFGLLDLSPLRGMRSNPFLGAVARETERLQGGPTPDGSPSVPYILFVIRPDGIRPYYEALMRLEPLGLAFGYELVDQDWEIDYPNPDDFSGGDSKSPAPDRWPADRPLAGGRGGKGEDSPLVGLAGSGLGASDAGGKPLLFSGESGGGTGFEPTPPSSSMSGTGTGTGTGLGNGGTGLGNGGTSGSLAGLDPIGNLPRPGGGTGVSGLGERPGQPGGVSGSATQPRGSDLALMPFAPAGEAAQRRGNTTQGGNRSALPGGSMPSGADSESLLGSSLMNSDAGTSSNPGESKPGVFGRTTPTLGGPPSQRGRDTYANGSQGNAGQVAGGGNPSGTGGGSNGSGGRSGQIRPGSPSGSGSSEMQNPSPRPPGPLVINAGRAESSGPSGPSGPAGAKPVGSGSASPPKPEGSGVEPAGPFVGPRPERNLDLVVSCGPKGVVIHPGAYRLSTPTLKAKEANLVKALKTIVSARQLAEPETIWKPQVRFQVEPGGQKTYWTVRGQVLMEGLDWPTTVRLADSMPRTFGQELR